MEKIIIVYYEEPIDSFGRKEASMKGEIIFAALNNVEDWTDDMIFESDKGRRYSVDELQGKTVQVNNIGIFKVPSI